MKAYLINPPAADGVNIVREGRCMQRQGAWTAVWAPISLALIASLLEKEGWEVKISDCIVENISHDGLEELVAGFKPDIAVINAVTPAIKSDLSTCRNIKKGWPSTITAAIGIHPSSLPEECLRMEPGLDFVIRGEPEITVKELAAVVADGKKQNNISGVNGLSYLRDGQLVNESARPGLENLDTLPFPAWHLIKRDRYILPFTDKPFLLIATSRGCPYSCRFCADNAYYGKKLRTRSAKNIVDELSWVKNKFGISEFLFWSESFTINKAFAISVIEEIKRRNLNVSWVCNSRVDNVDAQMLRGLKEAGCWMIGYGIESGNQSLLDKMGKGVRLEQIRAAVIESKKAGLEVTGHCVLGYPGETVETIKETIQLTLDLPFNFVQFYCSVPFPGSQLYEEAKQNCWIINDDWAFFEQNYSVMDTPQLSAEEVMKWRSKAYRMFYTRPKMVWQILRKIKSLKELFNLFKMVKEFLSWI